MNEQEKKEFIIIATNIKEVLAQYNKLNSNLKVLGVYLTDIIDDELAKKKSYEVKKANQKLSEVIRASWELRVKITNTIIKISSN